VPTDSRTRHLHPVRPRRTPLSPSARGEEVVRLFSNGQQSVRLTRVVLTDSTCHMLIDGPGDAQELRSFADIDSCTVAQSEIEHQLLDRGFHRERHTSDRRLRHR
jgi:hypothetical protein